MRTPTEILNDPDRPKTWITDDVSLEDHLLILADAILDIRKRLNRLETQAVESSPQPSKLKAPSTQK